MASREVEKLRRQKSRSLSRKKPARATFPTLLIVCEGRNTEPSYFNALKFKTATIEAVGQGCNTLSLVRRAQQLVTSKAFDEVWCVFDKDDFPDQDFNQAIVLASAKGFRVAYSNQAFEYWLLLHFNDHQGGALHRNHYADPINRAIQPLGAWYDAAGSKIITPEFFHLLFGYDTKYKKRRVDLAIERAKRIYERYSHQSPADEESSTTVHVLLDHLLAFSRPNNTREGM